MGGVVADGIVNLFGVTGLTRDGAVRGDWPHDPTRASQRPPITKPEAVNLAYWLLVAALGTRHPVLDEVRPLLLD